MGTGMARRVAGVVVGMVSLAAAGDAHAYWVPYPYYGYGYAPRPVVVVPAPRPYYDPRYYPRYYPHYAYPEYAPSSVQVDPPRPVRRPAHPVRVTRPAAVAAVAAGPFAGPGSVGAIPVAVPPSQPSPFTLLPGVPAAPVPRSAVVAPPPIVVSPPAAAAVPGPRYEIFPPEADGRTNRD